MTSVYNEDDARALLDRISLHGIPLASRIVMPAMTRCRATSEGLASQLMRTYYKQRAWGNLIITECNMISKSGRGYPSSPGLYNYDQTESWSWIVNDLSEAGTPLFAQLWHPGRLSDPTLLGGHLPVAPSPLAPEGRVPRRINQTNRPFMVPRELSVAEISEIILNFGTASHNARRAGFNGGEVHAGFGYLVDQFLHLSSNARRDSYGGTQTKRIRFLADILDEVTAQWDDYRVGVLITPLSTVSGMFDDKHRLFGEVLRLLNGYKLAYVHTSEPIGEDFKGLSSGQSAASFVSTFTKHIKLCSGMHTVANGANAVRRRVADLIGFGRLHISNPDLVQRIAFLLSLKMPDPSSFYEGGAQGYTNY